VKDLALNAGSNTLRLQLILVGADERTENQGSVDQMKGRAAIDAAREAIDPCRPLGIDAGGERNP